MFKFLSSTGGITARCKFTTPILLALMAMMFSGTVLAQAGHGVALRKSCEPNIRVCGSDAECTDLNQCTTESCDDTTYPLDTFDCEITVSYNDTFGDHVEITDSWDEITTAGGVVRVPAVSGNLPIILVLGDASCPGNVLPCIIGPGVAGGDPGEVVFRSNTYQPTPADLIFVKTLTPPNLMQDNAKAFTEDQCDGALDELCPFEVPFPAGVAGFTSMVLGCVDPSDPYDCSDLDDVCGSYVCDPDGTTQDNCETFNSVSATTICRSSAGICDVVESCDGVNAACPSDGVATATTECRADGGICDVPESCDGTNVTCPSDAKVSATTECRADGGICDVPESCDGINDACPTDAKVSATTECRADGGICDVPESCDGINDACPSDAKVSATTECRADGGICDVPESCDGINDACPADAKVSATTECRADAGECDVPESCDGLTNDCPVDGYEPPGTVCGDDGNDDCFEPLCDGAGNCTQDNEILPPPDFCVEDEICRTPGFWKNRGGDEKNRPPGNITQAVIDGAGGLDVCGFRITTTAVYPEAGWEESALEAMCVSVKGVKQRQLIRQLTAAALNCEISGGAGDCSQFHQDLISDCNVLCAANSDSSGMGVCIDAIDDFNNGLDAGGTCNDSGDFCYDVGDCTGQLDTRCEPNDNCHDRSMCPDEEDGPVDGSDYCFGGGPTSSTGACKAASKNGIYLPATP
jgi:hypothetical protein